MSFDENLSTQYVHNHEFCLYTSNAMRASFLCSTSSFVRHPAKIFAQWKSNTWVVNMIAAVGWIHPALHDRITDDGQELHDEIVTILLLERL